MFQISTHAINWRASADGNDFLVPEKTGRQFYELPYVAYQADSLTAERFELVKASYIKLLENIETLEPIQYRMQNGGDYDDQ